MKKTLLSILLLAFSLPVFAQSVQQEAQAKILKQKHEQKVSCMQDLLKRKEELAQAQVENEKAIDKLEATEDVNIKLDGGLTFSASKYQWTSNITNNSCVSYVASNGAIAYKTCN